MIGTASLLRFLVPPLLILQAQTVYPQRMVTLRLSDWADTYEIRLTERCLEQFRLRHPSIRVQYEPNPGRVYEEKILTALAAGDPPDVFLLDSKLIPTFTNKNILLDLCPFVDGSSIDTTQWFPGVTAIARRGGQLFAFPKGFTPLVVYYNRELFRQVGLAAPSDAWTWNDYLRYAQLLTVDRDSDGTPDQYGAGFSNRYYYWIPWVWSAGGDVVDPQGERASGYLNSPATESALQFLIDLVIRHRVSPVLGTWVQGEKTGVTTALFSTGKLAMLVDGHWRMPTYRKYIEQGQLDIGVAPLPRHPSGRKVNVLYESGWCVPRSTRHPREAVLLASFMAGEEACRIRAEGHLELPAVAAVAEELAKADTSGNTGVFVAEVPHSRQPWGSVIERFSQVEWTLQDAVDEVLVNGAPMHETMTRSAARIDKELADIGQHRTSEFHSIREHSEIPLFLLGVAVLTALFGAVLYGRTAPRGRKTARSALGFLSPSLLHLAVFVFTPIVFSAYLSLHRWDLVVAEKPFVGLGNFAAMAQDPYFWNALGNTLTYTLNVPVGMTIALLLALLLNRRLSGVAVLRAIYFLPSMTSVVAAALVWMWIYHPSFGMANFVLSVIGFPPLQWLNSEQTALMSVMIFTVWLGLGYQMVIFLAGLQAIPSELYAAARVDGAGPWRLFWNVTLPLLKPTTFFVLVTSFIASFQVFTSVYVMTAGGPVRSTDVFVYHIYQVAWEQLQMGYASAMSWVLFVIIMAATWVQFRFMGRGLESG
jgi:multiple sugar transport system permease protein